MRTPPPDDQRCTHIKTDSNRCRGRRANGTNLCWRHGETPDDRRCTATAATGDRCICYARRGHDTCYQHDPEERCTAHISGGTTDKHRAGERCRNRRVDGATVCEYHGGKAPRAQDAAERRIAEREWAAAEEALMAEAAKLVGTPVENPLTELASLAGRARAIMEMLEARVEKLFDADGDSGGVEGENGEPAAHGIRYAHRVGEQIRGEVQLYERAMDRFSRVLVDISRLKIDERLVAISEAQQEMLMSAIDAALEAGGVSRDRFPTAKRAAARHLRVA